jgi:phage-related baseplate assembly protein
VDAFTDTPKDILARFVDTYYQQTGETIRIGSEEYAFASAAAYVLSVYLNACDDMAKNRYIATARGEWLDALAATYGITERPQGTRASAYFALNSAGPFPMQMPAGSIRVQSADGAIFCNLYDLAISASPYYATLYAEEAGTARNGIAPGAWEIVSGGSAITSATTSYATAGGTDAMDDDDEAFRAWLENEIQSFAGAGTAKAYEARAKGADPRILDSYVLRQSDAGYIPGKVQIFIAIDDSEVEDAAPVIDAAYMACNADDFRPIGDLVTVDLAELQDKDLSIIMRISYEARFMGIAEERSERILDAYLAELRRKIGAPFCYGELASRLRAVDADGVYASDAVPQGIDPYDAAPIYPDPGCVINVQGLALYNVTNA